MKLLNPYTTQKNQAQRLALDYRQKARAARLAGNDLLARSNERLADSKEKQYLLLKQQEEKWRNAHR